MHYHIAAVVYAHDKKEAIEQGTKVFDRLNCKGCGRPFDYYTIEDVAKASSKAGQHILLGCMKATKAEFLRNLASLREALGKQTDEYIYETQYPPITEDVRFLAYSVGLWRGPGIFLYDNDGEGIRQPGHLKNAIEKWPKLTDKETRSRLDVAGEPWVVAADAHS